MKHHQMPTLIFLGLVLGLFSQSQSRASDLADPCWRAAATDAAWDRTRYFHSQDCQPVGLPTLVKVSGEIYEYDVTVYCSGVDGAQDEGRMNVNRWAESFDPSTLRCRCLR